MECLTLDVRGRTVNVNKLLPSYNPMWDFSGPPACRTPKASWTRDKIYGQVMGVLCFAAASTVAGPCFRRRGGLAALGQGNVALAPWRSGAKDRARREEAMKLDKSIAAVVTGGASGLGEATARMLAASGAKVAILDMQAERGRAVAGEIGGVFCEANVVDEPSVDAALARAREANGVERILVNCAGIAAGKRTVAMKRETGELVAHDLATFRRTVEVNLIGTYHMIAKSAVAMAALDPVTPDGGRGVITCTASVAAEDGQIGQAAYAASKGGVLGLTLPVARDLSATASGHDHHAGALPRADVSTASMPSTWRRPIA